MLIASANKVYALSPGEETVDPVVIYEGPIACVEQGRKLDLIACKDGKVVILNRQVPDQPADSQTPWQIASGIDLPIASMWILDEQDAPRVLLGTDDGAHVYVMEAAPARRIEAFEQLEVRDQWHTPWGGPPAVRTLAGTPDHWVYADIHVGSIMRSEDGGSSWAPVTPELHEDVHEVATSFDRPDRVAANTAKSVFVSDDRGQSWRDAGDDLSHRYGRALALCPTDADLMLATVSDGPHGDNVHGQLYRSEDAGGSWEHVADPIPDSTAENINTGRVAFTNNGLAWAAVGRTLYRGRCGATQWDAACEVDEPIEMLSAHPFGEGG